MPYIIRLKHITDCNTIYRSMDELVILKINANMRNTPLGVEE